MKLLKNILGIILATTIGSASWEFFLKDLLIAITNYSLEILSKLFNSYTDKLFDNLSQVDTFIKVFPLILIFISTVFLMIYTFIKVKDVNKKIIDRQICFNENIEVTSDKITVPEITLDESINTRKRFNSHILLTKVFFKKYILLYLITLVYIPIYFVLTIFTFSTIVFKISNKDNLERKIQIIRPYTSDKTFHELTSKFYLINNKDNFNDLNFLLDSIAKKSNVVLPKSEIVLNN